MNTKLIGFNTKTADEKYSPSTTVESSGKEKGNSKGGCTDSGFVKIFFV